MAKAKTPEEIEAEVEEEAQNVEEQVEEAGKKAKAAAEQDGVSEDEVTKRVEAARKEEKDKLYPQLEELKTAMKEVQDALRAEKQEKDKIKKEKEQEAERQRQESLTSEDRQKEVLERIEEQLREERQARLASEQRFEKEKRDAELREYRRNAIQAAEDAGEFLIPELVRGNTEEEIDAAVQHAKARYTELAERISETVTKKTKRSMPRPTSPSMEALEEEELSEQLNAIDEDKYQKDPEYREQIKNQVAQVYARSQGMT